MARRVISVAGQVADEALPGKSHAMAAKRGHGLTDASCPALLLWVRLCCVVVL